MLDIFFRGISNISIMCPLHMTSRPESVQKKTYTIQVRSFQVCALFTIGGKKNREINLFLKHFTKFFCEIYMNKSISRIFFARLFWHTYPLFFDTGPTIVIYLGVAHLQVVKLKVRGDQCSNPAAAQCQGHGGILCKYVPST